MSDRLNVKYGSDVRVINTPSATNHIDTSIPGTQSVTYAADPDAAGNIPDMLPVSVTITDTLPPTAIIPDDYTVSYGGTPSIDVLITDNDKRYHNTEHTCTAQNPVTADGSFECTLQDPSGLESIISIPVTVLPFAIDAISDITVNKGATVTVPYTVSNRPVSELTYTILYDNTTIPWATANATHITLAPRYDTVSNDESFAVTLRVSADSDTLAEGTFTVSVTHVDDTLPGFEITGVQAGHSYAGEVSVVITLDEPSDDFESSDVIILANDNIALTLTSFTQNAQKTTYAATFGATHGTYNTVLSIPDGAFTYESGPTNTAQSIAFVIDNVSPGVTFESVIDDILTLIPANYTFTGDARITVRLSEPYANFDASDVNVVAGDTPLPITLSGDGTDLARTFTLPAPRNAEVPISIKVKQGAFTDKAGNQNTGSAVTFEIASGVEPVPEYDDVQYDDDGNAVSFSRAFDDFAISRLTVTFEPYPMTTHGIIKIAGMSDIRGVNIQQDRITLDDNPKYAIMGIMDITADVPCPCMMYVEYSDGAQDKQLVTAFSFEDSWTKIQVAEHDTQNNILAASFDTFSMFAFGAATPDDSTHDRWQNKPTFGKSWTTNSEQLVKSGFTFNNHTVDITDNWHTDFARTSSIIGDINHADIKVHAPNGLHSVSLFLGVPEIGNTAGAESVIDVMLRPDYTADSGYAVSGIIHSQKERLVDPNMTAADIGGSFCNDEQDQMYCHTISLDFAINAPLSHDVIALQAVDKQRRSTITHLNDGIQFTGDSLLAPATVTIYSKSGNQGPAIQLHLVQMDRRFPIYEDQFGDSWHVNSFGTWDKLTSHTGQRDPDALDSVMTRQNSNFEDAMELEHRRALEIFDSRAIQGHLQDPYSIEFGGQQRISDDLLDRMAISQLRAMEIMEAYLGIYPEYDDAQ